MLNYQIKAIEIDNTELFLDEFGNETNQPKMFTGTPMDADTEAAKRQSIFESKYNRILKHVVIEQIR